MSVEAPLDKRDPLLCKRVASMAAAGYDDQIIAESLRLTLDTVLEVRQTELFKAEFGERTAMRVQLEMETAEGWDLIENRALNRVADVLGKSVDPEYALRAAMAANRAKRPQPVRGNAPIDANGASRVVIITLNRTYVNQMKTSENDAVLTIDMPSRGSNEQRRVDLPTPSRVAEILGLGGPSRADRIKNAMDELEIDDELNDEINEAFGSGV